MTLKEYSGLITSLLEVKGEDYPVSKAVRFYHALRNAPDFCDPWNSPDIKSEPHFNYKAMGMVPYCRRVVSDGLHWEIYEVYVPESKATFKDLPGNTEVSYSIAKGYYPECIRESCNVKFWNNNEYVFPKDLSI